MVLNLYRSPNKKSKSLCRTTISNYANLVITNDDKITLGNMSTARLKSLSRIIASESERTLCAHTLVTIACQFRSGKWTKKQSNLLSGAITAEKLTKNVLDSDEVHPIDRICVLCFDEHGHIYILGSDLSSSRRPVGKRSLNSAMPDSYLKTFK